MKHSVPKKIVLIGASTGGPGQIRKIIASLPPLEETTIVIAQHMASGFIESFASSLQELSQNKITLVTDNTLCHSAQIYICEGDTQIDIKNSMLYFSHNQPKSNTYNPNINKLFLSFVPCSQKIETLCVILTGIGDDGVRACLELSKNGTLCMTETQQSAIVDGMPHRARESVPNIEVFSMQEIIHKIAEFCK